MNRENTGFIRRNSWKYWKNGKGKPFYKKALDENKDKENRGADRLTIRPLFLLDRILRKIRQEDAIGFYERF